MSAIVLKLDQICEPYALLTLDRNELECKRQEQLGDWNASNNAMATVF